MMKFFACALVVFVVLGGSVCQAGFLNGYASTSSSAVAGETRTVRFAVWQREAGDSNVVDGLAYSPEVNLNEFVYLYQVLSPAVPNVIAYSVDFDTTLATQIGVAADLDASPSTRYGSIFSGATSFSTSVNARNVSHSETLSGQVTFTIAPSVGDNPSPASEIMYIVSTHGPELGIGHFLREGTNGSTSSVPVPVPLPATLGLAAFGVPFIRALRRKSR